MAFAGGIDLCHSRRDDAAHHGDPQRQPMAAVYGHRPPWHDIQLMISGPAVGDLETVFRERWEDPAPLTRNPLARIHDLLGHVDDDARRLPPQQPDPPRCGHHAVQVLRTYPYRRRGYSFAPHGERSIARAYLKVLPRARSLIYLEDQYLWSNMVADVLARALSANPALHLIAVLPAFPDQDGKLSLPPNLLGRAAALETLRAAGGDRVAVYSPENEAGVPIYVHAKVCVVDDTWAIVGSDNFNRRSWTHDSELSCAVIDEAGAPGGADDAHGRRAVPAGAARRAGPRASRCRGRGRGGHPGQVPSRHSGGPRRPSMPGTRAGGAGHGLPGSSAATLRRSCRPGPGRGRPCRTG